MESLVRPFAKKLPPEIWEMCQRKLKKGQDWAREQLYEFRKDYEVEELSETMKDLVFLMLTLGLIAMITMAAQKQYRGEEADKNRKWERERYYHEAPQSPTPSPTPSL